MGWIWAAAVRTGRGLAAGATGPAHSYLPPSALDKGKALCLYLFLSQITSKISREFKWTPNLMIQISSDSINHDLSGEATCTFFQRPFLHRYLPNPIFPIPVMNFRKSQGAQTCSKCHDSNS